MRDPLRRPLPVALLLGAVAEALFAFRITVPPTLVFDEVHYVPAARALWTLTGPRNTEHPLLGKELIGLGIRLFGDDALGWRALSTVAGACVVMGVFAILWLALGRMRPAVLGAVLAMTNITVFVQARIAMLDGFMAAFVVGGVAVMLWAMRAGGWWRWCLGAALLGLAVAAKWAAVPYVVGAGCALLLSRHPGLDPGSSFLLPAQSSGTPAQGRGDGRYWPHLPTIPALALLVLVSAAAYLVTFAPAFFYAEQPLTLTRLLPFQLDMLHQQTQVLPHHTYQSSWWTWPLMLRPIWYLYEPVDGAWRGVLLVGNPAVMWGGLVAVPACLWASWRDRRIAYAGIAALWLTSWLVWAAIPKSLGFFYYYYLPSIFLCVALGAALDRFARGRLAGWDEVYVTLSVGLFLYFYPITSAMPLAGPRAFAHWTWFRSWI